MGVVYRAQDEKLDRTVALKVLPDEFASDPDRLARFVREARAASALTHPNLAHIYDIGEHQGVHFIAMEYIEGESLQRRIAGEPLPPDEIMDIGVQVAEAHADRCRRRDGVLSSDRTSCPGARRSGWCSRGFFERPWPPGHVSPEGSSVRYRQLVVSRITELRRGLDYLETRSELDGGKIAFFGTSAGVTTGLRLAAIEARYRAVVFAAGGAERRWADYIPEANPLNFASHIRVPKLLLNGRYDEEYQYRTDIEPLFKLLGDPNRQMLFDSGQVPPLEELAPVVNAFLDETLGPVRRD